MPAIACQCQSAAGFDISVAQALDWRREAAAAAAERDHLLAEKKAGLPKRGSSGSIYAGYNGGTPRARGQCHATHLTNPMHQPSLTLSERAV